MSSKEDEAGAAGFEDTFSIEEEKEEEDMINLEGSTEVEEDDDSLPAKKRKLAIE